MSLSHTEEMIKRKEIKLKKAKALKVIILGTMVVFLLCFNNSYALAGDYVARLTGNYSPQDSLIIGEISEITDKSVEIKVIRIVAGKICKTNIL